MMASTTMSANARSFTIVVNVRRPIVATRASSVSFPFSIAFASDFSMLARARAADGSSTSRTIVLKPFSAATCAIPEPISPPPSTPTVAIVVMDEVEERSSESASGPAKSGARRDRGEERWALQLATLETVQHLLERQLRARDLRRVAPRHEVARDESRRHWQRRDDRHHTERGQDAARDSACRRDAAAARNALRAHIRKARVQPHDAPF